MMQMLLGILLGAMVSTETGRKIGNQVGDVAIAGVKQMIKSPVSATPPTGETEESHEVD